MSTFLGWYKWHLKTSEVAPSGHIHCLSRNMQGCMLKITLEREGWFQCTNILKFSASKPRQKKVNRKSIFYFSQCLFKLIAQDYFPHNPK